jgi:hypothetical protein
MVKKLVPTKPVLAEILIKLQPGKFGMEQFGFLLHKNPEKNRTSTLMNSIASDSLATKLSRMFLLMLSLDKN